MFVQELLFRRYGCLRSALARQVPDITREEHS